MKLDWKMIAVMVGLVAVDHYLLSQEIDNARRAAVNEAGDADDQDVQQLKLKLGDLENRLDNCRCR